MIAAIVGAGCAGDRKATGFCAEDRARGTWASTRPSRTDRPPALAQINRMIGSAPATVAPALKTMSTELSVIYNNPKAVVKDWSIFERYSAAVDRVDQYLRDECGLDIPHR